MIVLYGAPPAMDACPLCRGLGVVVTEKGMGNCSCEAGWKRAEAQRAAAPASPALPTLPGSGELRREISQVAREVAEVRNAIMRLAMDIAMLIENDKKPKKRRKRK